MAITQEDVIDYLSNLKVVEIADLTKQLEEKWGVTAAPIAVAGGVAAGGGEAEAAAEKTEFDVILKAPGGQKIQVIKAVREVTSLGLKDAKDMVDGAPKAVKEGVSKEEAEEIQKKLTEAGAEVEIK